MKRFFSLFICVFLLAAFCRPFYSARAYAAGEELLCGDLDESGVVDLGDLTILAKHVAGWTDLEAFSFVAADVFTDGFLDLSDITHLAKLIAGWQLSVPDYQNAAPKVFIIGDSTADTYYYWVGTVKYLQTQSYGRDLMGWGYYLNNYFNAPITVRDEAWSGRSARSYYTDAAKYNDVMKACKSGDYCIIQFGHNDEVMNADRYSSATLSWHEVDESCMDEHGTYSFQAVLYYWYILPLMAKGVTPILASPITRLGTGENAADYALHIPYTEAVKSLARELGLSYLPMMETTAAQWEEIYETYGASAAASLHAYAGDARTSVDRTHLSHYGAYVVAGLYADELSKAVPRLAESRRALPLAFDGTLPDWVEQE